MGSEMCIRDSGQVHLHREVDRRGRGPGERPGDGSDAERRVEPRHDRPTDAALDLGPLDVHRDDPAHRDPEAARALGHPDVVAPPTFAVIVAQRCEAQYVADPASGIDFTRVVHGDEKFRHHRPIVAGDRLVATLHVDMVRVAGGHGMVSTRVEIADEAGQPVSTVTSMLVVRGGE